MSEMGQHFLEFWKGVCDLHPSMKYLDPTADKLAAELDAALRTELASQAAKIEAVRGLIESEGECTWCGWPFKNGIHAYDCAAAITFNLPEGEVVDNSYAKLRTRKGFVLAALES